MQLELFEYTEHFARVDASTTSHLTSDGIHWTDEVETSAASTDVDVISYTVNPLPYRYNELIEIQLELWHHIKCKNAANNLKWKWQIKGSGGSWQDLHAQVTETTPGTSYVERTRIGIIDPGASGYALRLPVQIRLRLQSNGAKASSKQGYGQIRNDSYMRIIGRMAKFAAGHA